METKHTNRTLLMNDLKKLLIALLCMFVGPTLTYISAGITDTSKKYAALVLGILLCLAAIYFAFMGIKTIVKSMFS